MSTRLWITGCNLDAVDSWMGSKDEEALEQILEYADEFLGEDAEPEDLDLLDAVKQFITELVFAEPLDHDCGDPDCEIDHEHAEEVEAEETGDDHSKAAGADKQDADEEAEDEDSEEVEEEIEIVELEVPDEEVEEEAEGEEEFETLAEVTAAYVLARCAASECWPDGSEEEEWAYDDLVQLETEVGEKFGEDLLLLHLILGGRSFFDLDFDPQVGMYSFLTNEQVVQFKHALQRVQKDCAEIVDQGRLNEQKFGSSVVDIMEYMVEHLTVLEDAGLDMFVYFS